MRSLSTEDSQNSRENVSTHTGNKWAGLAQRKMGERREFRRFSAAGSTKKALSLVVRGILGIHVTVETGRPTRPDDRSNQTRHGEFARPSVFVLIFFFGVFFSEKYFFNFFDLFRVDTPDSSVNTSSPGKWLGMQPKTFPRRYNAGADSFSESMQSERTRGVLDGAPVSEVDGKHRSTQRHFQHQPPFHQSRMQPQQQQQQNAQRGSFMWRSGQNQVQQGASQGPSTFSFSTRRLSYPDLPSQSSAPSSPPKLELIPNFKSSTPLLLSSKSQVVSPLTQTCNNCRRQAPYLCRRCQQTAYCSSQCQRAHFPSHRQQCEEAASSSPSPTNPHDVLRPPGTVSVNLSSAIAGWLGKLEEQDAVHAQHARHLCQAAADGDEAEVTRLLMSGGNYVNAEVKMDDPDLCSTEQPFLRPSTSSNTRPDASATADAKDEIVRPALCTPLIAAAIKGHVPVLRRILAAGAYPNQTDPKTGLTALMLAQHPAAVDTLLAAKANPHLKAKRSGKTAVMFAAERGSAAVIEKLSTAGADLNWREVYGGCTAIRLAAQRGNWEAVKKLIDLRADANRSDKDGVLPLMVAAFKGFNLVVKELLQAHPDINHAAVDGLTSLMYAVRGGSTPGHSNCLAQLIEAKAALDRQDKLEGLSALMAAARSGNADAVSQLLKAGADTQLKSLDGLTAFDLAQNKGHVNIAEILKAHAMMNPKQRRSKRKHDRARRKREAARVAQAGAEGKAAGNVPGTPAESADSKDKQPHLDGMEDVPREGSLGEPLPGDDNESVHSESVPSQTELTMGKMVEAVRNEDNATLATLLNALPEERMLDSLDPDGNHPLVEAARLGGPSSRTALTQMLEAGTSVDVRDKDGSTALMHAACAGNDEFIQLLLVARADLNLQDRSGFSALEHAALNGRELAVNHMIVAQANLDLQDKDGFTALKAAALHGRDRIVARLLEANADLSLNKTNGPTALQCASTEAVIKLLKAAEVSQTGNLGAAPPKIKQPPPSINTQTQTLEAGAKNNSPDLAGQMQERTLELLQVPYVSTPVLRPTPLGSQKDDSSHADADQEDGSQSGHDRDSSEDSVHVLGEDSQEENNRAYQPGNSTPECQSTPEDGSQDGSENERKEDGNSTGSEDGRTGSEDGRPAITVKTAKTKKTTRARDGNKNFVRDESDISEESNGGSQGESGDNLNSEDGTANGGSTDSNPGGSEDDDSTDSPDEQRVEQNRILRDRLARVSQMHGDSLRELQNLKNSEKRESIRKAALFQSLADNQELVTALGAQNKELMAIPQKLAKEVQKLTKEAKEREKQLANMKTEVRNAKDLVLNEIMADGGLDLQEMSQAQLMQLQLVVNKLQSTIPAELARRESLCVHCVTKPRQVTLVPCAHQIACVTCSQELQQCPVCQTAVKERVMTHRRCVWFEAQQPQLLVFGFGHSSLYRLIGPVETIYHLGCFEPYLAK
eukprot:g573.t1